MTARRTSSDSDRLLTLDALRGVAAILVVTYHAFGPDSGFLPGGYFAVDFFFILSGLVIGRTYQERLDHGLSFSGFMKTRLIRLYPLFALGLILDTLRRLTFSAFGKGDGISAYDVVVSFAREAVMLPSSSKWGTLFSINPPAWSLFMEVAINAVFALALFRLRAAMLLSIAGASFAVFGLAALSEGTFDLGPTWDTAPYGFVRTLFGFSVGMLIARSRPFAPRTSWLVVVPAGVLMAAMLLPSSLFLEALCIGLMMPALVFSGALINPPGSLRNAAKLLGEASYPMYAIHWPLLFALQSVGRALHLPTLLANGFIVVVIFLTGLAASRLFEIPVRQWLNRRFGARSPRVPVEKV